MGTSIIDTHLHLVCRDRLSYPWLADVAPLDRDFHYETYAVEARRCGVTDALHMEVDVGSLLEGVRAHINEARAEYPRPVQAADTAKTCISIRNARRA